MTRAGQVVNRRPHAASPRATLELLEERRLLATISGYIFEDLDGNRVISGGEVGQAGVAVYLDQNFNNVFDAGEPGTTSDAEGFYSFPGVDPGTFVVRALPPEGQVQTFPGPGGQIEAGNYDIDVEFLDEGTLSPADRQLVLQAVNKWEQVIVGDLPDVFDENRNRTIDDMLIEVETVNEPTAPFLGFANDYEHRSAEDGGLPYFGRLTLNVAFADAATDPTGFRDTILHEIGHDVGFLDYQFFDNGLTQGLTAPGTPFTNRQVFVTGDPRYVGENALREYNRIFETVPGFDTSNFVPLENRGQPSHWRESTFDMELMTSTGERRGDFSPFSTMTAGVMQDIGYTVDYSQADVYVPPGGAGTPDQPFATGGSDSRPFSVVVQIEDPDQVVDAANFGHRPNTRPSLVRLNAASVADPNLANLAVAGEPVRLTAAGAFDPDTFADDIVQQVVFYQESNGVPGLQTKGANADTYLAADGSAGRFQTFPEPDESLAGSSVTFYARGYDRALATTRTVEATVQLVGEQEPPARPTSLTARALGTTNVLLRWNDNATTEFGYRVEVSTDPDFEDELQERVFSVGPNTDVLEVTGLTPGEVYFSRVRAFNNGGSSAFAGRPQVVTLTPGEILLDPTDAGRSVIPFQGVVSVAGEAQFFQGPAGFNDDFLAVGAGSAVVYNPLVQQSGDYFLFANNPGGNNANVTLDVNGQPFAIDQTRNGGFQFLGNVELAAGGGNLLTLVGNGQSFLADAVRLVPAGVARTALASLAPAGPALARGLPDLLTPGLFADAAADEEPEDDAVDALFA